ncbi:MAG: hypothetical protein AAF632_27635 [Bacteroidota bacterium]
MEEKYYFPVSRIQFVQRSLRTPEYDYQQPPIEPFNNQQLTIE